jgi:hypothetical protein
VTDDLVKRLREFEQWMRNPEDQKFTLSSDLFDEAADRIEQLEAALLEIVAMTPDPEFGTLPIESAIKVARTALGEKKDD